MDTTTKTIVHECSQASVEGRINFREVVGKLIAAGVERYHADLIRSETTYYWPNGESELVASLAAEDVAAETFSASSVEAAVKAAQAGTINYKTFCKQVLKAGCVGYLVSIAGKRVVYYGRTGDIHVEWFPGAKPAV